MADDEKLPDALSVAYDIEQGKVDYRPYKNAVLDVLAAAGKLPVGGGKVNPTVKEWHKAVLLQRKRDRAKRYRQGEAGRAARARYKQSDAGKAAKKRYRKGEAGKAAKSRSRERRAEREQQASQSVDYIAV